MKILTWCVSVLFVCLIVLDCAFIKMSNSIVDLREKTQTKLAELDASKNKLEIANLDLKRLKEDLLRECAKPNKTVKNATQIFEESQFVVAITKATPMEEALGEVFSPNASGFVVKIDNQIFVITAKHVCMPYGAKAEKIVIHFKPAHDGKILNSEPAEIVDVCPSHDLGVLKIKNKNFNFPWLPGMLGASKDLKPGDKVFELGSPSGGPYCITEGCVMNLNPILFSMPSPDKLTAERNTGLTEYSTITNHGNSGGPIIDDFGKIVGMTTNLRGNYTALAITPNIISSDIEKIVRHQKISHAKIDADFGNSWELNEFTEGWQADPPKQCGIITIKVTPDSDAWKKGLKREDLIISCDGVKPRDAGALLEIIALKDSTSIIELKVRHENGVEEKLTVQLSPLH